MQWTDSDSHAFSRKSPRIPFPIAKDDQAEIDLKARSLVYWLPLYSLEDEKYSFALALVYCSAHPDEDRFGMGKGWKFSFQRALIQDGDTYVYVDEIGKKRRFVLADNLTASSPTKVWFDSSGSRAILFSDGGAMRVTFPLGDYEVFTGGRLTRSAKRFGDGFSFIDYTYDLFGRLSGISLGGEVSYSVSCALSSVTVSLSPTKTVSLALGFQSVLSSVTDIGGDVHSFTYDTFGTKALVSASVLGRSVAFSYANDGSFSQAALSKGAAAVRSLSLSESDGLLTVTETPYGNQSLSVSKSYLLGDEGFPFASFEPVGGRIESASWRLRSIEREATITTAGKAPLSVLSDPEDAITGGQPWGCSGSCPTDPFFLYFEWSASQTGSPSSSDMSVLLLINGITAASDTIPLSPRSGWVPSFAMLDSPPTLNFDGDDAVEVEISAPAGWSVSVRKVRLYPLSEAARENLSCLMNGSSVYSSPYVNPPNDTLYFRPGSVLCSWSEGGQQASATLSVWVGDLFASAFPESVTVAGFPIWHSDGKGLKWGGSPLIGNCQPERLSFGYVDASLRADPQNRTWCRKISSSRIVDGSSMKAFKTTTDHRDSDVLGESLEFDYRFDPVQRNELTKGAITDYFYDNSGFPTHSRETTQLSNVTYERYLTSRTWSSGHRFVEGEHEAIGSALLTKSAAYDSESRLSSAQLGGLAADQYAYGPEGELASRSSGADAAAAAYSGGDLASLSRASSDSPQDYGFSYGSDGELSAFLTRGATARSFARYRSLSGHETEVETWPTGETVTRYYDIHGRLVKRKLNNNVMESYAYGDWGQTPSLSDPESNVCSEGARLVGSFVSGPGIAGNEYDEAGRLTARTENGRRYAYSYDVGLPYGDYSSIEMAATVATVTDSITGYTIKTETSYAPLEMSFFRRPTNETSFAGGPLIQEKTYSGKTSADPTFLVREFDYDGGMHMCDYYHRRALIPDTLHTGSNSIFTSLVQSEETEIETLSGTNLTLGIAYSWNSNGMLASMSSSACGISSTYSYNSMGELSQETAANGICAQYVYDSRGNMTQKIVVLPNNMIGVSYRTYDANDRLLTMSEYPATTFAYDAAGRPTSYKGKSLSWLANRLTAYGRVSLAYDGLERIASSSQTVSGATRTIARAYEGERLSRVAAGQKTLEFVYGVQGDPIGFVYAGDFYYFHKDVFGDVLAIYKRKTLIARYAYDAWGRVLSVTGPSGGADSAWDSLANLNPFRFRGYMYEPFVGMYYLGTRFYDPEVGRFISPDDFGYLDPKTRRGLNLYVYCANNPVMGVDPTGHAPNWNWEAFWAGLKMVAIAIGAVILSVTTFGAGIPIAMSVVAGVTLGAGILTGINGIATIIEAGTGYNFVRDGIFNNFGWTDEAYDFYAMFVRTTAVIGTTILTLFHMTGRYKAAKASQRFLGRGYGRAENGRWISADGYRQVRWDTTGHRYGNIAHTPPHFNLETFQYPICHGVRNHLLEDIHLWIGFFDFWE